MPPTNEGQTETVEAPNTAETAGDQDGDTEDEPFDKARAMNTIRTLRRQSEADAKARKAAEKKAKDLELASMSEAEKTAKRLADLEAEKADWSVKERRTRAAAAVTREVAIAGAAGDYIDLATKAVADELAYDDEGNATNIAEVVADAKKKYPALFAAGGPPPRGRADAGPNSNRNGTAKPDSFGALLRGR